MNRKRLFIIGSLSLLIAAFVTLVAYKRFRPVAASPLQFATVVVADSNLAAGSRIAPADLRIAEYPVGDLPDGTFQGMADLVGRGVIVPIHKNELVLASKLASAKGGAGLPSLIPSGKRAVSVQVNEVISVAGFVAPGTHVDVLLTGRPSTAGAQDAMTTTVLENVEVLAAGQEMQQNPDGGKPRTVTAITLLVTPEEAQKLTLASSEGHIQLALRNPLDGDYQDPKAVKSAALYHIEPAPAMATATASRPRSGTRSTIVQTPAVYVIEMIKGDKRDSVKF
jgi:pilus assembly protein CpaB